MAEIEDTSNRGNQDELPEDWARPAFVDDYRLYIAPAIEEAREYKKFAVEYAQIAIRSAYLLNGGALVAIPAYASLFGTNTDQKYLMLSAVAFVSGLALIILSTIACHANFYSASSSTRNRASANALKISRSYWPRSNEQTEIKETKQLSELEELATGLDAWIGHTFRIAWATGLFSYISFLLGVYLLSQIG